MNLHLRDKIGPLQAWQWLAALLAILLAWRYMAARKAGTSSSTTTAAGATTPTGTPPVVVNTFGDMGGGFPSSGPTTSSAAPAAAPQPTGNPYQVAVSDVADEQIAEAAGIPQSWLAYAGSDPNAANPNAAKMGYTPPTDLPTINPGGAPAIYLGLANKVAPAGAQTVYGQTREGTITAAKQWSQHYVMGQG